MSGVSASKPAPRRDSGVLIRKARPGDIPAICDLIAPFAAKKLLLPRTPESIARDLAAFRVAVRGGQIVGCCAVHRYSASLAEIRSLAVSPALHGRGVGRALVETCFRSARRQGLRRVFVLTYNEGFFSRMGFSPLPREELPDKIWKDCMNCPRRENCREVAMIREALR